MQHTGPRARLVEPAIKLVAPNGLTDKQRGHIAGLALDR
jgi:hypothetical protein